jgi:hypothetical protein
MRSIGAVSELIFQTDTENTVTPKEARANCSYTSPG